VQLAGWDMQPGPGVDVHDGISGGLVYSLTRSPLRSSISTVTQTSTW
jgi:hypothetical protein